jgi:tetratricopeptide (TPR) repeat protein
MHLPNEALLPLVKRVQDPDQDVRATALRISGERGLAVVREQAEALAANVDEALATRRLAIRVLGQLGRGSFDVLRGLAKPEAGQPELTALAAWALGAARAPTARRTLQALLERPELASEGRLYMGLARLGGQEGRAGLLSYLEGPTAVPKDHPARAQAIFALGFLRRSPQGAADLARLLARHPDQQEGLLEALADRGDEAARVELAQQIVRNERGHLLRAAISLSMRAGPVADEPLRQRVGEVLAKTVRRGGDLRTRGEAAQALARLQPERARALLHGQLRGGSHPELARELARALARAGDPSLVEGRALSYSRSRLERADTGMRTDLLNDLLNDVGIDLLYAGRCEEAIRTFERMLWVRPQDEVAAYNVACGYSLAGEVEPALRYLRRSIRSGYKKYRHMLGDTDLDNLRADPRFQRIITQIKLVEETQLPMPDYPWPEGD